MDDGKMEDVKTRGREDEVLPHWHERAGRFNGGNALQRYATGVSTRASRPPLHQSKPKRPA
jgi:hypothetical protein